MFGARKGDARSNRLVNRAMTSHPLAPSRASLHGQFSASLPPALRVRSGDRIVCSTLEVGWGVEARGPDGWRARFEPRESPRDDGPCLLGPIHVEGAEPGDVLEVEVVAVVPGPHGWTYAGEIGFLNGALNRALGVAEGEPRLLRWSIDRGSRTATSDLGHRVRIRPFLGTLGLCPAGEGWHSGWTPRREGGNWDCAELVAGSRIHLPVAVEGALLSLGDGHAAQGDGEVAGTAIECPMERVELRLTVRRDPSFRVPRAETPRGWVTFGFGGTFEAAAVEALSGMLDLLEARSGEDRKTVLALAGAVVDLRVTQLVNGVVGAHAVAAHDALAGLWPRS